MQVLDNFNVAGHHQRPTNPVAQVFLAYAAADEPNLDAENCACAGEAVRALRQLFTQANISYWQRPHPWPTNITEPEVEISRATEACDNYVLVLSPRSLADTCCLQGLLFALSMNKRIVPLLAETVPPERLPEPLQTLEMINLQSASSALGQARGDRQLLQTLGDAADYHRAHTQLLVKALAWERQRRDPALLLTGNPLDFYQQWLGLAQGRSHHRPIQLQALYVAESARHRSQTQGWLRRWLG